MTTYEHSFATRTTKQTDYAVVKFTNGEEVIAKVITSSKNDVTLSDPVQIHRIVNHVGHEMIRYLIDSFFVYKILQVEDIDQSISSWSFD